MRGMDQFGLPDSFQEGIVRVAQICPSSIEAFGTRTCLICDVRVPAPNRGV